MTCLATSSGPPGRLPKPLELILAPDLADSQHSGSRLPLELTSLGEVWPFPWVVLGDIHCGLGQLRPETLVRELKAMEG